MLRSAALTLLVATWVLSWAAKTAAAADPLTVEVDDRHVAEALEAAGDNRPELERALALAESDPDPRVRLAVRFLVANMPEKGYVVAVLRDAKGEVVPFDPTDHPNFREALAAVEAMEAERGEIDVDRERFVPDVETITCDYLLRHVKLAFRAWEAVPDSRRVSFEAFGHYVLPYRGSEEPLDDWLDPLLRRYADLRRRVGDEGGEAAVYARVVKDVHQRVPFDERYYLHPTDQGFTEMSRSGLGRCEDITNMITFAARSLGLATAADYTPAWGHSDNNHAWNVLLDAEGRGADPGNAHAAKVYRKTFAVQRDALAFRLPEGREAPNRFLASRSYVDVTDQYAPTTDVAVALDPGVVGDERFAYLCVFNGGRWVAIHWAEIHAGGRATFDRMGRNLLYLPAVHDGESLRPAGRPCLVHRDGSVVPLPGTGSAVDVVVTSTSPRRVSPDTGAETPVSFLEVGAAYRLHRWDGRDWEVVGEVPAATAEAPRFEDLPADGLYWLTGPGTRRLERPFTVEEGRQRFW